MGSQIIREVIKDLAPKGLKQAKVVMLAGTRWDLTGCVTKLLFENKVHNIDLYLYVPQIMEMIYSKR